ncbi:TRAP transporter small permease [Allopusillimonas ginsengisoli]|uniref:TRAP transporter small permease n=1 Tax=Allopusillimonas ginsengisoli TaxID=453575 RepID=UPI0039C31D92
MLESINKIIDRIEGFAMILLMLVATVVAIVQVIARYVFNNSLSWSEETILYSLIIMSFVAGSMGVRYAAHICVEVLPLVVGPRLQMVLKYIAALLGVAFALTIVYYGGRLFLNTLKMGQLSPAMRIPVAYIYLIIPVSGFSMLLRYLWIVESLIKHKEYKPLAMDISST